jgi:hypothetical protein
MNLQAEILFAETIESFGGRPLDAAALLSQIGTMNFLSISGGRHRTYETTLDLPVSQGYRVTITLDPSDTYTVRRVYVRGASVRIKGEISGIYADQVGEVAYRASLYRDDPPFPALDEDVSPPA